MDFRLVPPGTVIPSSAAVIAVSSTSPNVDDTVFFSGSRSTLGADNFGEFDVSDAQEVTVTTLGVAVEAFLVSPDPATVGEFVNFNASISSPVPGGTITMYRWNFRDGSAIVDDDDPFFEHKLKGPGRNIVTLTITSTVPASGTTTATAAVEVRVN